jgi:hypothetical protein
MLSETSIQMSQQQKQQYRLGIIALCVCYIIFQMIYIPYTMLARDELWFAHHIYQYTQHIPYRDFSPYKTVLGYYLLSIPLYFSHGILAPLFYIKDEIALFNGLALGVVALWASTWFQPRAIFYTLMIIIASQFFLIYSVDLRVDMLASWLCLVSALLLLSHRAGWAGVLLAVGFLVSQKVLWYIVASNGALLFAGFLQATPHKRGRAFFLFNAAMFVTLTVYVGVWSGFASVSTVLHSVFYESYTQSKITFYAAAHYVYWRAILQDGPLFILLWPLTFLSLFDAQAREQTKTRRVFIAAYASLVIVMMVIYQQLFPYNIVFFVPAFFVLYAEFFTWLLTIFNRETHQVIVTLSSRQLFWFFSLYVLVIVFAILYFTLPLFYLTIISIPLVLWSCLEKSHKAGFFLPCLLFVTLTMTGVFYPLVRMSVYAYTLNGQYQKDMIRLTDSLLQDKEEYLAGVPLLYNKNQTVAGLKNLIAPAIQYLYTANPSLIPVLLPALDMAPRTVEQVLSDLQNKPVKVLVNNDRIMGLPPRILDYLRSEFQHYWGSIYLYAPTIVPSQHAFSLKFTSAYQVESAELVMIDGKSLQPNSIVSLASGNHLSRSNRPYRLRLTPATLHFKPQLITHDDCASCFAKPIVF